MYNHVVVYANSLSQGIFNSYFLIAVKVTLSMVCTFLSYRLIALKLLSGTETQI